MPPHPHAYNHTTSRPIQQSKTQRSRPKSISAVDVASLLRVVKSLTDEETAQAVVADLLKLDKNKVSPLSAHLQHGTPHQRFPPSDLPISQHRSNLPMPTRSAKPRGSEESGHSLLVRFSFSQIVDRILLDLEPAKRSKDAVSGKELWSSGTIRYLTRSQTLPDGRMGSTLCWHFSQKICEEAVATVRTLAQRLTSKRPAVWIDSMLYSGSLKHLDLLLELIPQHASDDLLELRSSAFRILQDCLTHLAPRQHSLYDLFSYVSPPTLLLMHGAPLVRHPAFHMRLSQLLNVDHGRFSAILERTRIFFDASDQVYYRLSSGVAQALNQERREECNALRLGMLDRILGALFPKACDGDTQSFTCTPYSHSILALFTDPARTPLSRQTCTSTILPSNWSQVSGHRACRSFIRFLISQNTRKEHHQATCAVLSRYVYDIGHWLSDPSLTCPARMAQDVICEIVEWLGGRLRVEGRNGTGAGVGSGSLVESTLGSVLKSAVRISGPSSASTRSGVIKISFGLEGERILEPDGARGKSKFHHTGNEKSIPRFSMTVTKENAPRSYSVRLQPLLLALVQSALQTRNYDGPGMRVLIGVIVDALQARVDAVV